MKPKTGRRIKQLERGRQDLRKIIHIAVGMSGFLYAFFDWEVILFIWIIGTACAWILPLYLEPVEVLLTRAERQLGYSPAMISYGIMMIAGTVIFRENIISMMIVLSSIAFGDGFSGLIGSSYRGTPLPWNERKSWAGSMAFIIFGTIGALVMIFFFGVFAIQSDFSLSIGSLPILRVLIVMVFSAIIESIPWRIPDNIPVALATILALLATTNFHH